MLSQATTWMSFVKCDTEILERPNPGRSEEQTG